MAGPPGKLRFSVQPWAEVEVDGHVVGVTPLKVLELPAGVAFASGTIAMGWSRCAMRFNVEISQWS